MPISVMSTELRQARPGRMKCPFYLCPTPPRLLCVGLPYAQWFGKRADDSHAPLLLLRKVYQYGAKTGQNDEHDEGPA
jgi:hypothetical protein